MFQDLNNYARMNRNLQFTTLTNNRDQSRNKKSATVTSLDNNAGCNGSTSCPEKTQSNKPTKSGWKNLSSTFKMNTRDGKDNTRTAANNMPKAVPSTCTRQSVKVNGSKAPTLNPQYSYKTVAAAKSDAESGNLSRVNMFAVVFQVLKVGFLTSLLFPHFINS